MRVCQNYVIAAFLLFVGAALSCSAVAQPDPKLAAAEQATTSKQSLAAILEAYFAWRGGAAFEHLQSIHQKSLADETGQSTDEYWFGRSGEWRDEFEFGGVKKDTVYRMIVGLERISVSAYDEERPLGAQVLHRLQLQAPPSPSSDAAVLQPA